MAPSTKIDKRGYWFRVECRVKMICRFGLSELEAPVRLQRNNACRPFEVQENLTLDKFENYHWRLEWIRIPEKEIIKIREYILILKWEEEEQTRRVRDSQRSGRTGVALFHKDKARGVSRRGIGQTRGSWGMVSCLASAPWEKTGTIRLRFVLVSFCFPLVWRKCGHPQPENVFGNHIFNLN